MLDLLAIEDIKPLKEDIRCRGCLKFNTILHASDVWQIEDEKFVRITLPVVDSCFLIDKICKGSILREEDYEIIDACEAYEECSGWDGINKSFIVVVQGIVDYLILTENKEFDKAIIVEIAKGLEQLSVAPFKLEEEEKNKFMRKQFGVERMNFGLMEAVRSRVNDT